MIVTPLEEWDSKKWLQYQKDILALTAEFQEWGKRMTEKYLAHLSEEQRKEMMHRVSEDARYIISLDIEKLLGKK